METAALMVVMPMAIAAARVLPAVLRETALILKSIRMDKELAWSKGKAEEDWACILSLVNTLELLDGSWPTNQPHNQPLFHQMKKKAESLHKKMEAGPAMQWVQASAIKKKIKSISNMMQLLMFSIKAQEISQFSKAVTPPCNLAERKARRDQKTKTLRRNIAEELAKDDLKPLKLTIKEDYAKYNRSGVYPQILYYFKYRDESEADLPCTFGISQGVRGCIELILRFLRKYKVDVVDGDQSKLVGESLLYIFTKLLPKELKNYANLPLSQCYRSAHNARQFRRNIEFLRKVPGSPMYKAIQSKRGLGLVEKDAQPINLCEPGWLEWESLFKEFEISSLKNLSQGNGGSVHPAPAPRPLTKPTSSNYRPTNNYSKPGFRNRANGKGTFQANGKGTFQANGKGTFQTNGNGNGTFQANGNGNGTFQAAIKNAAFQSVFTALASQALDGEDP